MKLFIDQIDKLRPREYPPKVDPQQLQELVRLDYFDKQNTLLGYLVLYKQTPSNPTNSSDPATTPPSDTKTVPILHPNRAHTCPGPRTEK